MSSLPQWWSLPSLQQEHSFSFLCTVNFPTAAAVSSFLFSLALGASRSWATLIPTPWSAGWAPHLNAVRACPFLFTGRTCSHCSVGSPFGGSDRANFTKIFPAPSKCFSSSPNHLQVGPTHPSFPVHIACCAGLPNQSSWPNPQSCICRTAKTADPYDAV